MTMAVQNNVACRRNADSESRTTSHGSLAFALALALRSQAQLETPTVTVSQMSKTQRAVLWYPPAYDIRLETIPIPESALQS